MSVYSDRILSLGPVAYWRLGDAGAAAVDVVGGNNGTYQGTVSHIPGVVGDSDKAADVSAGGWVRVPGTPQLAGSAMTCEAWARFNPTASWQMIYGGYDSNAGYAGWAFALQTSSNNELAYYSGVSGWALSTVSILDANWHHVVVTVTAGGVVSFYIDGQPAGTTTGQPPSANPSPKALGSDEQGSNAGQMYALDEVALYPIALTPAQVLGNYNAATAPPPSGPFTDAVTGTAITGKTITGAWWAYPTQAGLKFGSYPPAITIVAGNVTTVDLPEAGLKLGAYAPAVTVVQNVVVTIATTPGLLLGKYVPALGISSTITLPEAGLLLGMFTARFIGQQWVYEFDCEEIDLAESSAEEIDLVASSATEFDLVPSTCR